MLSADIEFELKRISGRHSGTGCTEFLEHLRALTSQRRSEGRQTPGGRGAKLSRRLVV